MTRHTTILQYRNGTLHHLDDVLAVEEPLEIRIAFGAETRRQQRNLSITMRTPGDDADLTAGFLFTEGLVRQPGDITDIVQREENAVVAELHPDVAVDFLRLERHFYTSSSCGVCGKSSVDAVKVHCEVLPPPDWTVIPEVLLGLPRTLRAAQAAFDATGGLHASALFTPEGVLLALREDVGRHNALDKLIGHYFRLGRTHLSQGILLLSGRASFELVQKAAVAGVRYIAAVGAPSSLAVETAASFGITLAGFLREGRYNVYP